MLSGYLGPASHLWQRRLSFCASERERQHQREHREEEEEGGSNEERRRREQELLFLQRHRQHHERLSDGEEDSYRGRAGHHLVRSPSRSPPIIEPEETDDVVPRAAAGDLSVLAKIEFFSGNEWETKEADLYDMYCEAKVGPSFSFSTLLIRAFEWWNKRE